MTKVIKKVPSKEGLRLSYLHLVIKAMIWKIIVNVFS